MVLHKDSPRQERWNHLKETNPVLRKLVDLRQQYDESENPVISSVRSVTSTIGSWFEETEQAQVIRQMRLLDPTFDRESFEREYLCRLRLDFAPCCEKLLLKLCSRACVSVIRITMLTPHILTWYGVMSKSTLVGLPGRDWSVLPSSTV